VLIAAIAEVLAVWGAVTGTLGATIGLFTFLRDRPKLEVLAEELTDEVSLQVVNNGRRPVAVIGLGVTMHPIGAREWLRRLVRRGSHIEITRDFGDNKPIVLEPGHVESASVDIRVAYEDPEGRSWTLRTFALDTRGHRAFGESVVVERIQVGAEP
jgi:hypothetical protein